MSARIGAFRVIAWIVLAHAAVNLVHGVPHAVVPVPLSVWQNAIVVGVVLALPLGGLWLAWRERPRAGGAAILIGGLGSAVFGTYYHFLSATPDNVANVTGAWSLPFLLTSVGISLLALATSGAGAWLLHEEMANR
jgi:hypothetical protein